MSLLSILATLRQSILRKGAWHWVRFLILLVAAYFASHALKQRPELVGLRYWLYRHQLKLQGRAPVYPRRTSVITIEDDDYWGDSFAGRAPLKRNLLAGILDKLREASVNTVVLDVDLRSPDSSRTDFTDYNFVGNSEKKSEDEKLLQAMKDMCHAGQTLILGTSFRRMDDGNVQVKSIYTDAMRADPASYSCVRTGYIELPTDLRRVPGQLLMKDNTYLDSLSLAALKTIDPTQYSAVIQNPEKGFRFARYLSEQDYTPAKVATPDKDPMCAPIAKPPDTQQPGDKPHYRFTWKDIQDGPSTELRRQLADRIVLIGGAWHALAKCQGPEVDSYNSPMGSMPGVFLHANYIEALDGERGTFAPLSDFTVEILEFTLAVALALIGILEIHAAWKWGAFALSCIISVVLTYVLLENLGIFLDFLVPFLILIGHTLVEELLAMRHEIHHLRHSGPGGHS